MNSIQQIAKELKEQMLRDYLSGMGTKEMMQKYGFKHRRTIYYHLASLSNAEKILHKKNMVKQVIDAERNK